MITQMGLTIAIKAEDVNAALDAGALNEAVKDLADQAQGALRHFVGGAKPRSDIATNLAGPEDDPIQGPIYALTLAAYFDTDDLPGDCDAYRVYVTDRGERTT